MADKCLKCGKTVYAMERIRALKGVFHKMCFRCTECSISLNLKTFVGFDGKPYCKVHVPKVGHTAVADDITTKRVKTAPKARAAAGIKKNKRRTFAPGKMQAFHDNKIRDRTSVYTGGGGFGGNPEVDESAHHAKAGAESSGADTGASWAPEAQDDDWGGDAGGGGEEEWGGEEAAGGEEQWGGEEEAAGGEEQWGAEEPAAGGDEAWGAEEPAAGGDDAWGAEEPAAPAEEEGGWGEEEAAAGGEEAWGGEEAAGGEEAWGEEGAEEGGWDEGAEEGGWDEGAEEGGWDEGAEEGGWDEGAEEGGWDEGAEEGW